MSITDESELQRTALGGLKGHGKKGTVGTKRTGNATLSKSLNTGYCKTHIFNSNRNEWSPFQSTTM